MRHLIKYWLYISIVLVAQFIVFWWSDFSSNYFWSEVIAAGAWNPDFVCDGTPWNPSCASSCGLPWLSDVQQKTCRTYRMWQLGETANFLDSVLSFIYLIMWPLLFVAGLAMDNTLVYGEWLGLTGLLYQFWSIMRTIANVSIVFVIIYTIGRSVLNPDQMAKDLFKTLWAILIWGVLINASWFFTGALIDVSTIATYAVGTIPLKLNTNGDQAYCNEKGKKGNISKMDDLKRLGNCRPLLSTHSTQNFSDVFNADKAKRKAYYSYRAKDAQEDFYFLSCPFKNKEITDTERDTFVTSYIKWVQTFEDGSTQTFNPDKKVAEGLAKGKPWYQYCVIGANQLLRLDGNLPITQNTPKYEDSIVGWMKALHNRDGIRIRNLVDSHRGMIGVMYSMYGNILWYSNLKTDIQTNDTESQIIQFLIKWFFWLAMIFPLIALCIILVMRVAFLWIVIGFAPILVIVRVLQAAWVKALDSLIEPFKEKFSFGTIIGLLFQPVIIVFVISMGTMFLDSLMITMTADKWFGDALQCNQEEWSKQCCKIVDFVDICFEDFNAQAGTDQFFNYFTYAILNVIGVMLLWFMVFAIFKSNKITKAVWDTLENAGKSYMWWAKIIPRAWWMASIDGVKDSMGKTRTKLTDSSDDATGATIVQPSIDKAIDNFTGKTSSARSAISKASEEVVKPNLKTREWVKNYNTAVTSKLSDVKKEVQQASADNLVSTYDKHTSDVLWLYGETTVWWLYANPQYIADVGQNSDDMMKNFNIGKEKTVIYEKNKQSYNDKLAAKVEKWDSYIKKISAEDGVNGKYEVIWIDGQKVIYEYNKVMDEGKIKSVKFAPLKWSDTQIGKTWPYKMSDIQKLSSLLTYEELLKFINNKEWKSKWEWEYSWEVTQSAEDKSKRSVKPSETKKEKDFKPETKSKDNNDDWKSSWNWS